jgi:hypothetical protein
MGEKGYRLKRAQNKRIKTYAYTPEMGLHRFS